MTTHRQNNLVDNAPTVRRNPLTLSIKLNANVKSSDPERFHAKKCDADVDIDLREVYFLIMHFLSSGPCQRTCGQLWNELLEHQLLPRRYHAWYSRIGKHSGDENDDGISFPLSYTKVVERHPHIEQSHLVKLLKQLLLNVPCSRSEVIKGSARRAALVPTLLGMGSFSLLGDFKEIEKLKAKHPPAYLRWPHAHADQVHGLFLREIGGGFTRHHRAPSIPAACFAIAKPSLVVQRMQNITKLRGHRNAVYCAIFDCLGRHVITGSDDRLVKIWSMETAFCLASCRGHEGDITDLAVSSNNMFVASASNDCVIRVWHLPDGHPISVLRGHTAAVTAIAFRPGSVYQLLSSSDDGTCRIWDCRSSHYSPQIYDPRHSDLIAGHNGGLTPINGVQTYQILCCAFNASGTVFVTGSSDSMARVWVARKPNKDDPDQPNHEIDTLSAHKNDVNYVQFCSSACSSRFSVFDCSKEENVLKLRNPWFSHDNIVTCSRDGSAIIWSNRSRRQHGKAGRWNRLYHLKVPPPPLLPQPSRRGPRQRTVPVPRGVNMIMWSLDNRFVLAAIMDCRICVWNASDGNLLHSLTGHTESTYVLDVHPFNPRVAMSAGYDGKTIIWDIWEGIPIQIHEISRFKLVDGKFSPDGTSIILSDDVGQLYILNTGEGKSQPVAQYDQFFLGDYRPLIQDTHGHVLDKETQLPPYQRNMQDLLCDSGMNPYPEPYQSMFQKRRLGALGKEWQLPSIRLAVGPDFNLDPEYQIIPLADLDVILEPLPEFIDAMELEPEMEAYSDDNDSEYNATEGYSTGAEHDSLNSAFYGSSECSVEDSDGDSQGNYLRSRKTKQNNENERTNPYGRHVKRKLMGDFEASYLKNYRNKKGKGSSQKALKKRLSMGKSLRPQRAAARNALTLFSKITGKASDLEEEDDSECDVSESESTIQGFSVEPEESDGSFQYLQNCPPKLTSSFHGAAEELGAKSDQPCGPTPADNDRRKKLIIKLQCSGTKNDVCRSSLQSSYSAVDVGYSAGEGKGRREEEDDDHLEREDEACQNMDIQWGGAKARTSKNRRLAEPIISAPSARHASCFGGHQQTHEDLCAAVKKASTISTKFRLKANLCLKSQEEKNHRINGICQVSGFDADDGDDYDDDDDNLHDTDTYTVEASSATLGGRMEMGAHHKLCGSSSRCENPQRDDSEGYHDAKASTSNSGSHDWSFVGFHGGRNSKLGCRRQWGNMKLHDDNSINGYHHAQEKWRSSPRRKKIGGLRSTRNRRPNYFFSETSLGDGKKIHHPAKKGSWLLLSQHEEGSHYIPQLGDEVAYLRQGHQEYIDFSAAKDVGPWQLMKGNIRAVEFCKVEDLEYCTASGSGDSCCKMILRFTDPTSNVFQRSFNLTLPEVTNFPDFLVERTRFDGAIQRNWTSRDRCRVWWKNEGEEDGSWWDGRIISVQPKSAEFLESPWERFTIRYRSEDGEQHLHSPWELFDADTQWEQPRIADEIRNKLLYAFARLEESGNKYQDRYGVQTLKQVSQKSNFMNRYPVPISLGLIQSRLDSGYYRSLDAMNHDMKVMLTNAELYFLKHPEDSKKIKRLSEWFSKTLSSL